MGEHLDLIPVEMGKSWNVLGRRVLLSGHAVERLSGYRAEDGLQRATENGAEMVAREPQQQPGRPLAPPGTALCCPQLASLLHT